MIKKLHKNTIFMHALERKIQHEIQRFETTFTIQIID